MNRSLIFLCCLAVCSAPSFILAQEKPSGTGADHKPASAVIAIPFDEELYFNKEGIKQSDIPQRIKEVFRNQSLDNQVVYIKASWFVKYGTIVSVMERIREAGIQCIGLVAKKKGEPNESPLLDAPCISSRSGLESSAIKSKSVVIKVHSRNRLRLNSRKVSLSKLSVRLGELLSRRSDKAVYIKAPKRMLYGEVIKVIDIAKGVGAQPIGLEIN